MADKYDIVEEYTADISLLEELGRETIRSRAEEFRESAIVREIVNEVYTHDDWDISLNAPSLVDNEGYPQVHVFCIGRPGVADIRVRMDGIDYTEEQIRKAEEFDAHEEKYGRHCYTISSMAEFFDVTEKEGM